MRTMTSIFRILPVTAAAALMLTQQVSAQEYPARDVRVVVGFAPGGATDLIARLVSQKLGEKLGRAFVVENRGGASGAIASRDVSKSAPDGYTMLTMTSSLAISETANKNKGFSVSDLRAVAIVAISPYALTVHPSNPAKTLKEFIAAGREKSFTYGSPGVGSGPHIGAEYFFKEIAKVKAVHVPFANARAEVAAQGGHIDALVISLPAVTQSINENLLRGLGVASEARNPAVPQMPTLAEGGYPNINLGSWNGFFVPAKTPDAVVKKLNAEINQIMQGADVKEKLKSLGFDVIIKPLPETSDFFKSEVENWGRMVTAVGFSSD
ncbi:Bug family tripartite tricarboxylate transporter substrate binding protein [Neorhizobium tomejilense]|uniref:Bug family tripartite tricarboxylate transporter substrate binding protein n=1 Tax=Neorhizobium tomejilense TaxID=2093828 RepID=UPI003ECD8A30